MARLIVTDRALEDMERLVDFARGQGKPDAEAITEVILEGVAVLERHPFAGRPSDAPHRELVVTYGDSGFIVLHLVPEPGEFVVVLAIRHQRESGFP